MIEKGNTPGEYVDLLLTKVQKRDGWESVRQATRDYLVNGTSQTELAKQYGIGQNSISRLVGTLRELDKWVADASKYHNT